MNFRQELDKIRAELLELRRKLQAELAKLAAKHNIPPGELSRSHMVQFPEYAELWELHAEISEMLKELT